MAKNIWTKLRRIAPKCRGTLKLSKDVKENDIFSSQLKIQYPLAISSPQRSMKEKIRDFSEHILGIF